MKLQVGDRVIFNQNLTVKEIVDNYYWGCKDSIDSMISKSRKLGKPQEYVVDYQTIWDDGTFKNEKFNLFIKKEFVTVVKRASKVKELSVKQISDLLGYEVKVVK